MEATEVFRFSDARASLWTGVVLKGDGSPDTVADHMVVEPDIGTTDDVLVLHHEGQRTVLRLQQVIQLEGTDPALPVSVSLGAQGWRCHSRRDAKAVGNLRSF